MNQITSKSHGVLVDALRKIMAECDYVAKNGTDNSRRGLPGIVWRQASDALKLAQG